MPRSHARILTKIWSDPDFRERTAEAQRVYLLALSQPTLSYAGVLPYTPKRWAGLARNTKLAAITSAVRELTETRFVVVDEETEEMWIRTFVRHDGVLKIPNTRIAMWREIGQVQSLPIRLSMQEQYPELFAQPNGQGLAQPLGEPWTQPNGQPQAQGLLA